MRVPEISLGYGLLAQNKHDLCRYYKYTERHKQTQYLPAYTVSFMVVPSVRAWEFRVSVDVHVSPQFLSWIISLGDDVKIIGPEDVVERMREEIRRLSRQYGE